MILHDHQAATLSVAGRVAHAHSFKEVQKRLAYDKDKQSLNDH